MPYIEIQTVVVEIEKVEGVERVVDPAIQNQTVCWASSVERRVGKGVQNLWRRECWEKRGRGSLSVDDKIRDLLRRGGDDISGDGTRLSWRICFL